MSIHTQPTLPTLDGLLYYTRYAIGMAGEIVIARSFQESGYSVSNPHSLGAGDLIVYNATGDGHTVEVKTARRGKDKCYRFTLYKYWKGKARTDHRNVDYIVLLAILSTGQGVPFVIPASAALYQRSICISGHPQDYAGKFAQYRQTLKGLRLP
jgi:hypothetical protein